MRASMTKAVMKMGMTGRRRIDGMEEGLGLVAAAAARRCWAMRANMMRAMF